MEAYPADYLVHNLPFILLSGLGSAKSPSLVNSAGSSYPLSSHNGVVIKSDLPSLTGQSADQLLECFLKLDASNAAWNNRPTKGRMGLAGYRIKAVGRVGQGLPSSRTHGALLKPTKGI